MARPPLAPRAVRRAVAAVAAATLGAAALSACSPAAPAAPEMVVIGGYGSGLQSLAFDAETGGMDRLAGEPAMGPSLFAWAPSGVLVVKLEDPNRENGAVATYRVGEDGAFELISTTDVPDPSYVAVSPSGKWVVATDWAMGNVVTIPLSEDGVLGDIADTAAHEGSGPPGWLPPGPHAHSVVFDRAGERLVVSDAGNDIVYVYELDEETGGLTEVSRLELPPGSTPRHAVFHPDRDLLYIDGESSMQAMVLSYDQATGALELLQSVTALSPEDEPTVPQSFWGSSDLALSPGASHLYVLNRGPETITIFAIGEDGLLAQQEIVPSGGKTPRSLLFTPDGAFLFVANQNSGAVNRFAVAEDGSLTDEGVVVAQNGAAVLAFVPAPR